MYLLASDFPPFNSWPWQVIQPPYALVSPSMKWDLSSTIPTNLCWGPNDLQYVKPLELKAVATPKKSEKWKRKSLSRVRLFVASPWNSPGQNTGVGRLTLLQGIFPTQGSKPGLPHCRWFLYQLTHQGSPQRKVVIFILTVIVALWFLCPVERLGVSGGQAYYHLPLSIFPSIEWNIPRVSRHFLECILSYMYRVPASIQRLATLSSK